MINLSLQILSEDEQSAVHEQSIEILSKIGVRVYSEKCLDLLSVNGALVDREDKIAKIPRELVEEALRLAPQEVVFRARNPKYDLSMPAKRSWYGMDGTGVFTIDFNSGERRYGITYDIADAMRVFQAADLGALAWPPVCASDKPHQSRALHEFFTMMKFTSKHGQHELHTVEQAPYLIEGLVAIAGSEDLVRNQPQYSLIYCPVAPLSHDGAMMDAYLELGMLNMPIMIMTMPVNGTTGPASLFSNIALGNAEILSSIVIFELAHPGRPLVYSCATGNVDFKTGAYLAGTPEMGLQSAALVEMGRFYHLPSTSAGCSSDAREPGGEAILEKLITMLPSVLVGSDIIIGYGEIESDQTLILEQIIVDNELGHYCERLVGGVDCSSEMNLLEDIIRVGVGGNFLREKSTRKFSHSSEFYHPKIINRYSYDTWIEKDRPSMYQFARKEVQAILESPLVDPLEDDVIAKLDEILNRADRELSKMEKI